MNFLLIISILLFIVAVILILKFVKSIISAALLIIAFFVIFYASTGFLIVSSIDYSTSLTDNTLLLLADNESYLTIVSVVNRSVTMHDSATYPDDSYDTNLIFNIQAIDDLSFDTVKIGSSELSKDDAMAILTHKKSLSLTAQDARQTLQNYTYTYADTQEFARSALFLTILNSKIIPKKNPYYFYSEYRKGNLKIYPKKLPLRLVKFLPDPTAKLSQEE